MDALTQLLPRPRRVASLPDSSDATGCVVQDGRATGVGPVRSVAVRRVRVIDARVAVVSNAGVAETLRLVREQAVMRRPTRGSAAKMRHWKMGLQRLPRHLVGCRRAVRWGSEDVRSADRRGHPGLPRLRFLGGYQAVHREHARERHAAGVRPADGVHLPRRRPDPFSVSPGVTRSCAAEECFPYALHGLGGPGAWDRPLRARNWLAARAAVPGRAGHRTGTRPCWIATTGRRWTTGGSRLAPRGSARSSAATSRRTSGSSGACPTACRCRGLYMSNGVWPVGLSWMAAGYNAAQVVASGTLGSGSATMVAVAPVRMVPGKP